MAMTEMNYPLSGGGGGTTHVECATGSGNSGIGFADMALSNDGTYTLATYTATQITIIKKCTVYKYVGGSGRSSEVANVGTTYTRIALGSNYLLVDDQ